MAYDTNTNRRVPSTRADAPLSTGNPFWDVMLSFGKASSQALTAYAGAAETDARPVGGQMSGTAPARRASEVEVIALGEETLNVGTRQVQGETTRVRRVVVETPVERDVVLREERVVVERRKPTPGTTATASQGVLTEASLEMSDTYEVAEVWKSVRVAEEVVLRREVTERHETVRDTVRRDEVAVEHAPRALRPAPRGQRIETEQVSAPRAQRIEAEQAPAQPERKAPAAPRAEMPDAAKLEADLKKVAERFEAGAEKVEQAAGQPNAQAPKAAEQPKAPATPARPETTGAQNDKGGQGRKV